jgi:hypothetical protein
VDKIDVGLGLDLKNGQPENLCNIEQKYGRIKGHENGQKECLFLFVLSVSASVCPLVTPFNVDC